MIRRKRAYDPVEPRDGWRVLVERLWPHNGALALSAFLEKHT